MTVSEAHPYICYMLLSYWLAVKVASAFSLVGHQVGWIKYGLDLSHRHPPTQDTYLRLGWIKYGLD